MTHPFDDALHFERVDDHRLRGATSPAYANMVGPFGGTTAAVMLASAYGSPARVGEPTAFTINYCGPVADGAFTIETRLVRSNRSNQHWTMEMRQDDDVACTASAVFATRRPTWSRTEARCPDVTVDAGSLERASSAFRPAWTRRYDMRFARGGFPDLVPDAPLDVPGDEAVTWVWLADDPPRPIDYASLTALCDAFFPRIFLARPRFTPIGTVSLTIYFHAEPDALARQADRPVLGVAWASRFGGGYYDEHAEVWSDDRHLLASAHQIVWFKE